MDNIVGQLVTGPNFYPRERELVKLWDAINSGTNVLFTAPKRTGKTSILIYLRSNPDGHLFVYKVVNRGSK